MSHHIYNTKCFIVDSLPSGESDKVINIYTEEFGLIKSVAKGVREMRSKLRYSLQEATYGTVALVRGREIWRVTNASKEISLFNRGLSLLGRRHLMSLLRFVARFAPGEGKNSDIFETLRSASSIIFRNQKMTVEELETLGLIARIKIMHELGYIKIHKEGIRGEGEDAGQILNQYFSIDNLRNWQSTQSLETRQKFREMLDDAIAQSHL